MRISLLTAACVCLPLACAAGEFEATAHVGSVFPFYSESLDFDPGALPGLPPGVTVDRLDVFHLDAHGGLALGGSVSYQFSPWLGVEGRVDTADVSVRITGARYNIRVDLPSPLPDLNNELVLGGGEADLHRIHPLSLNLRARTSGNIRFGGSAGITWLPSFTFVTEQQVSFQPVSPLPLPPATGHVTLAAEALPQAEGEGRVGANVGLFGQVALGDHFVLTGDARYFHFPHQTLSWGVPEVESSLPVLGRTLVEAIADRLEPVDFSPSFFQVTAGVTLRF